MKELNEKRYLNQNYTSSTILSSITIYCKENI